MPLRGIMNNRLIRIVVLLSAVCALSLQAAVTLPKVISDHMVLQQGVPVRIWGKANPGEAVTVKFQGQSLATKANASGKWEAYLAPLKAGSEGVLRIEADNAIAVRDVLVGEVWVASGQSNMVWPVERSNNPEKEAAAAKYPKIRLFKVTLKTSDEPLDDVDGEWTECSPESVPGFSAVGYFFARHIHEQLRVPVGVIQSAWGGTPAEAWTSTEALKADPALWFYLSNWDEVLAGYPAEKVRHEQAIEEWEKEAAKAKVAGSESPRRPRAPRGPGHQHQPATLYNAMIAPLTPFAIRGAIWYQGESNANRNQGLLYERLFKTMILDWREKWAQGDFPFLFVQLANFGRVSPEGAWPELRESQTKTLDLRNTGMAVTVDIGNPTDIHPKNKQDVGRRLALAARAVAYGQELVYSGPIYRQVTREGGELRVWFDHTGRGLRAAGGGALQGFVIAGTDRVFVPAEAKIDGKAVVVSSSKVSDPVAVRYAWAADPQNNLQNTDGLPASPFRSDRWTNARMPK